MSNAVVGNDSINPGVPHETSTEAKGLTKVEYFAAFALQGMLAGQLAQSHERPALAVQYALELIKALNEANPNVKK